jgi:hypothetical protein
VRLLLSAGNYVDDWFAERTQATTPREESGTDGSIAAPLWWHFAPAKRTLWPLCNLLAKMLFLLPFGVVGTVVPAQRCVMMHL